MNDLIGILNQPGPTLGRLMEKKKWITAFAIILIVSALFTYLTYPISKAEQAKFIRESKLAERLTEEQLENLDKYTPTSRITGSVFPTMFIVLALFLAGFFVYLFYKIGGFEGTYLNYFSGVVNASLIDMVVGGIVKNVLVLTKKSIVVTTSLAAFFPNVEPRSITFMILALFDLFSLWYLGALAAGVAVFAKQGFKKSLNIAILYFIFKSLILIAVSYFGMKIIGM